MTRTLAAIFLGLAAVALAQPPVPDATPSQSPVVSSSRRPVSLEDALRLTAAAVVGGASLLGGVGGALGPVIGAFLVGTLSVGLTFMGVSTYAQQIVSGAILVGAVGFDRWREVRARRRLLMERSSRRPARRAGRDAVATT